MPEGRPDRRRIVVATVAVALNLAVLFAPSAPTPPSGGPPLDKLVHVLVFALPTYALIRAGLPRRWVLAALVLWAPVSELAQLMLLDQRTGSWQDALADLVGIALGGWLARPRREIAHTVGDPSRSATSGGQAVP